MEYNVIPDSTGQSCRYEIEPIAPCLKDKKYVLDEKLPQGKGAPSKKWSGHFKFGFAPVQAELDLYPADDLMREQSKPGHPYHIKSQKIDVIINDIVLCQKIINGFLVQARTQTKDTGEMKYQG